MSTPSLARPRGTALLAVVVSIVAALALAASQAQAAKPTSRAHVPVIFVHGNQGSAQQWQSNAKRFSSNGYADDELYAYEYDTSGSSNTAAIDGLDGFIAGVRARTGAAQVDVLAHSRGTTVMHAYLATPDRAAQVRRYVNLDGRTSATPPGDVPTLALWGGLVPSGSIGGATNVHFTDMGHTETATSARSFAEIYKFLNGAPPATTDVIPEPPGQVEVGGRVEYFPQNTGLEARLEVWELDDATGARKPGGLRQVIEVDGDGAFGPVKVNGQKHYEMAVVRPGQSTYHFYFEPFERSDRFLRLQISKPEGIASQIETGPNHTTVTTVRNREWWGNQADDADNDRLELDGVNVLSPGTAPRSRNIIGVFSFDKGSDGVSHLGTTLFPFNLLSFLTGIDVFLPSSPDASDTITVTETIRGTGGEQRTVRIRNWPSNANAITVQLKDYADSAFSSKGR